MTLTFVPKLIAVIMVCLILGSWIMATLVEFAQRMFESAGML
jgi:flagellar biosynthetic protein FliQ